MFPYNRKLRYKLVDGMRQHLLRAEIIPIHQISELLIEEMYKTYIHYYSGTNRQIFRSDFNNKDFCILIFNENEDNDLVGFSAISIYIESVQNENFGIIYSGDTIIKHQYWGSNILIKAWLSFAGEVYRQFNFIPWYWLLLVKGHRTYRYLNLFFKDYYPRAGANIPENLGMKRDSIAFKSFGECFNSNSALIKFPETRGHLKEEWNGINEKTKNHKEVNFFKSQNPNFNSGDELVCFSEISPENLRKKSLIMFNDNSYAKFLPVNFTQKLKKDLI